MTVRKATCIASLLLVLVGPLSIPPPVAAQEGVLPPRGLVSWWPGDGHANDLIGANDGTLQGGMTFGLGIVGSAFSFDGVNDFVLIPHSPILNAGDELTIEFWFNAHPTQTSSDGFFTLIDKSHVFNLAWNVQGQIVGTLDFGISSDAYPGVTTFPERGVGTTIPIKDGTWHHFAGVKQLTECKFSLDFGISASPSSRTIGQGQAASYDVATTLTTGTTQSVALSVTGLPSGATATFSPTSITPTGSSTLLVSTTSTTPSGTFPLTIIASGGGITKSATVNLVVAPIAKESFMTDSQFAPIGSFDTVFTPDKASSSLKLAATNPGTYFYNKIIRNTGTSSLTASITLDIPSSVSPSLAQAFFLKGSNPVHVFSDLARTIDVTGTATVTPQQPLTTQLTSMSNVSVSFSIPAGELRYVTVHLDFAGKGSTGFASDAGTTYRQGFKFSETINITGITGTIADVTGLAGAGKRVTAIGGFALDTNLNYKSALKVRVFSGATLLGESPVTSPDGFYFVTAPAGGPYVAELFNPTTGTIVRSTTVQNIAADEYVAIDFLNLNPADPVIEGFVFDMERTLGLSGLKVELYGPGGRILSSTTTSASGWYAFRFSAPGKYTVRVSLSEDYTTTDDRRIVDVGQFESLRVDFSLNKS